MLLFERNISLITLILCFWSKIVEFYNTRLICEITQNFGRSPTNHLLQMSYWLPNF